MEKIIERAVKSLSQHNQQLDRDRWLKEAKSAEEGGHYVTCEAIVRVTIGLDVDDQDRKRIFKEDFEECMEKGYIHTARAIVSHALTIFPGKKSLWRSFADLEKNHGSRESLLQVLRKATSYCPQAEVLWLMGAKELWLAGQIAEARKVPTPLGSSLTVFNTRPTSPCSAWVFSGRADDIDRSFRWERHANLALIFAGL